MDFEELRQLQLQERKNELQKISEKFYEDAKCFVEEEQDIDFRRSKEVMFEEIKRKRFHKLVFLAIQSVETKNKYSTLHMTNSEKELFEKMKNLFGEWIDATK